MSTVNEIYFVYFKVLYKYLNSQILQIILLWNCTDHITLFKQYEDEVLDGSIYLPAQVVGKSSLLKSSNLRWTAYYTVKKSLYCLIL